DAPRNGECVARRKDRARSLLRSEASKPWAWRNSRARGPTHCLLYGRLFERCGREVLGRTMAATSACISRRCSAFACISRRASACSALAHVRAASDASRIVGMTAGLNGVVTTRTYGAAIGYHERARDDRRSSDDTRPVEKPRPRPEAWKGPRGLRSRGADLRSGGG